MFLVWVFDGLRPDLISAEIMPNLCRLRASGAWFTSSHCVFPSVTRVNAAALTTGSYPGTHGITANTLYLPDVSPERPLRTTGDTAVLSLLRDANGGRLLATDTLPELLARSGKRTVTVGTGSPGSTLLLDPEGVGAGREMFHHSFTPPAAVREHIEKRLGPQPAEAGHDVGSLIERVRYAGHVLTEVLVPDTRPDLGFFWCTVPDALHHRFGLGSKEASDGLTAVDAIFADVVAGLERATGEAPNVIVTADHGYATVERIVDAPTAVGQVFAGSGVEPVVAVDGGAVHVYLGGQALADAELTRRAARLLEADWAGGLLATQELPGAICLSALGLDGPRAADLVIPFAWREADNDRGVNGLSVGGGGIALGAGDHGGGSPFEMQNTLLAFGPAFLVGEFAAAAGIVDIAPTVCRVLGEALSPDWNGRVLVEALSGSRVVRTHDNLVSRPTASGLATRVLVDATGETRYIARIDRVG